MPTQIKHKIGSGAPLASDLIEGELGLDTVNGRAYTENSVGSIVELGTNPAGEIQANAGIALPDNQKATFGAGDELAIYSDGTHSYIEETGALGALYVKGTHLYLQNSSATKNYVGCVDGGATTLYNSGAAKLATTSTGINVTGTVTADGLTVTSGDASGTIATLKGSSGFGFSIAASAVSPYVQTIGVGGGEEVAITSGGTRLALFQDGGDISFYEDTGTTAKFFWDASAESLGIGTTSPSHPLTLVANSTSGNAFKLLGDSTNNSARILWRNNTDTAETGEIAVDSSTNMTFSGNGGTERMRIDSSGNLLVGTTTPAIAATNLAGFSVYSSGQVQISQNANVGLLINRKTSDGALIDFKKDGTGVGSIQSASGYLKIAGGSASFGSGLAFYNAKVSPLGVQGAASNGSIDLGDGSNRFKDLYLSGGVYLGGTGAANHLDDYETGTFTPTVKGATTAGTGTYTTQQGYYTKVGNLVSFSIYIEWSALSGAAGDFRLGGLPFTKTGHGTYDAVTGHTRDIAYPSTEILTFLTLSGTTDILMRTVPQGGGSESIMSIDTAGRIIVSGHYQTSS